MQSEIIRKNEAYRNGVYRKLIGSLKDRYRIAYRLIEYLVKHGGSMEEAWKKHGRSMEEAWRKHGGSMEEAWRIDNS
jgi:hypothetical protein